MAELARVTQNNLNIATSTTVLTYTYTGTVTREIITRVDLGDNAQPIAGGGTYRLDVFLDNVLIVPTSSVEVPSGQTRAIVVSRVIPLEPGDVFRVNVTGLVGDTNVNAVCTVRDSTPVTVSDMFGPGAVMVNHNYGGTDNLRYQTSSGVPIDNASVRVYLRSNYDAGLSSNPYIVAQTVTNVEGRWVSSLMLDPAQYTLIYYKQGAFGPDRRDVTVS